MWIYWKATVSTLEDKKNVKSLTFLSLSLDYKMEMMNKVPFKNFVEDLMK